MTVEQFNEFFSSSLGQTVVMTVGFLIFLIIIGNLYRMKQFSIKSLTFMAISISLAVILSFVKVYDMPQGGSITLCSMFFITIVGYMFGPASGILAGITFGLLRLAIKPEVYAPFQVVLDYLFGFGLLGLSGFFSKVKGGFYIGYIAGTVGRFVAVFLSGVLFFGIYAPEGMNVFVYSLLYNGSYILPEIIITIVIVSIPPVRKAIEHIRAMATK